MGRKILIGFLAAVLALAGLPLGVSAASNGKQAQVAARLDWDGQTVEWNGHTVAKMDKTGRMYYQPLGSVDDDTAALQYLLCDDSPKTLVLPAESTIRVNDRLCLGDNTTIIATDATVIQMLDGKGIFYNEVDGCNYDAAKSITIDGGTWKNEANKTGCTMFRFAHASDVTVKNAAVFCNYQGHALEFIACKNVVVSHCTLKAQNDATKSSTSVEEALQIDLATPITAPGVLSETGQEKYVNGQPSKNVTIRDSEISGSRGVCANYAASEGKFQDRYHTNVTIRNCEITGTSAEGVALFNTVGINLQDNTIRTESTRSGTAYANALTIIIWKQHEGTENYETRITGNTLYGKNKGIRITSKSSSQFGATLIRNNEIHVKGSTSNAFSIGSCTELIRDPNTLSVWK